jgi:hypothetical protein
MRRLVAAALGIVAGVAVAGWLGRFDPPAETPTLRIVPDSGGHLRELILHYAPAGADMVVPTYRDLLAALQPDAVVRVAVERTADFDDLRERLAQAGAPGLERLRPLVVGRPITIWSRDRFVTAERGGRPVLAVPTARRTAVLERANDWIVPFMLAEQSTVTQQSTVDSRQSTVDRQAGTLSSVLLSLFPRCAAVDCRLSTVDSPEVVQAPFAFDGGDIVADEEHVYATAALPGRNAGTRWADGETLREELVRLFDREPVILGTSRDEVPDHHICMIVTPIGGGTVLVGDPALGLRLLREAGSPALPGGVEADSSPETAARFARVADGLAAAGLRVVRVPLVPTTTPFVYVSYNNVLVDDRADGRHVFLPKFGVEALDAAARAVWEAQGFTVHAVDVAKLYLGGGALRCVAGVVRRTWPSH